jgi:hypothetical protein
MTKYREILRRHSLGFSQQNIAYSCGASKKTVNKVLKQARDKGLCWPLNDQQTDEILAKLLFAEQDKPSDASKKRMPDFNYIRATASARSFCGRSIWRNAAKPGRSR